MIYFTKEFTLHIYWMEKLNKQFTFIYFYINNTYIRKTYFHAYYMHKYLQFGLGETLSHIQHAICIKHSYSDTLLLPHPHSEPITLVTNHQSFQSQATFINYFIHTSFHSKSTDLYIQFPNWVGANPTKHSKSTREWRHTSFASSTLTYLLLILSNHSQSLQITNHFNLKSFIQYLFCSNNRNWFLFTLSTTFIKICILYHQFILHSMFSYTNSNNFHHHSIIWRHTAQI